MINALFITLILLNISAEKHPTDSGKIKLNAENKNELLKICCYVKNILFPVYIYNKHENEVGYCLTLPVTECKSYYKNGSLSFNAQTNMTTYVVKFLDETAVNGRWTCSHGSGKNSPKESVLIFIKGADHCTQPVRIVIIICVFTLITIVAVVAIICCLRRRRERYNAIPMQHTGVQGSQGN